MIQLSRQNANVSLTLRQLAAALAGTGGDHWGVVQALQYSLGNTLLADIRQDFATKSAGGTGVDGIKWAPLQSATIAGRRLGPADKKAIALIRRVPSLTNAQRSWIARDISRRAGILMAKFGLSAKTARGLARAHAESPFRAAGQVRSFYSILSTRSVQILRDTDELFLSLTPGVEEIPSGAPGNILRAFQGRITVGTNKKPWHHEGVPSRNLTARPCWPPDGDLPAQWWDDILKSLLRGLVRVAEYVLRRG